MTKKDYEKLVSLTSLAQLLYESGQPTGLTDDEYDKYVLQIKEAERQHSDWISVSSPTQNVGVKQKGFKDVTHTYPMLSIYDVFSKDDVRDWCETVQAKYPETEFFTEEKIDGVSVTIRYRNGILVRAETRGNGYVGSDITQNVLLIADVPKQLDVYPEYLEVRGEAYIPQAAFAEYSKRCEESNKTVPANARNLVAGTLRSYEPNDTKERGVRFFAFNLQGASDDSFGTTHAEHMQHLRDAGFPVVNGVLCHTVHDVTDAIDRIGENRKNLPYAIDGAVVKLNTVSIRKEFPTGAEKYAPGHIAFKYAAESRIVELLDVILDVGKTGKISFVGEIQDVETKRPAYLAGTYVSRVTLNNMGYIRDMKLGIGGHYTLIKSGEIIPKLTGCVKEPATVFAEPTVCPHCGGRLTHRGTVDLFCENPHCVAAKIRNLISFGERDRMDIDGLGESTVSALVMSGYVSDCADLYLLNFWKQEIIQKGILGEGVLTNLLKAINKSKEVPASRVLAALNIPGVGRHMSKDLLTAFGSIDRIVSASDDELLAVNGVGQTAVASMRTFFESPEGILLLEKLHVAGLQFTEKKESPVHGKLEGETVVVTGKFFKPRTEVQEDVRSMGGKVGSSVTSATTLLLVGEKPGSKLAKAQAKGIRIMTEAEFYAD